MRIDCGCCVVRSWQPDDLAALVRHANNPRVAINLRDRFPHPYTAAVGEEWLHLVRCAQPESSFAIEVDGEACGGIGFSIGTDVARCSAELGYWLGEDKWGRGIATAAVAAVTRYAIDAHELKRVFAVPYSGNFASRRVLVKAGYVLEGTLKHSAIKNGALLDQALYAFVPGGDDFF